MTMVRFSGRLRQANRPCFMILVVYLYVTTVNGQLPGAHVVSSTGGSPLVVHTSSDQLLQASTMNTLVIPGTPNLAAMMETSIQNRYTCGFVDIQFVVPDPDDPTTVELVAVPLGASNLKCDIDWGDGNIDSENLQSTTVTKEHVYALMGMYQVKLVCEDNQNKSMSCPEGASSCVTTSDVLDNFFSSFSTPLKFYTTDAVKVDSYMELSNTTCVPEIFWSVTLVNVTELIPFTDFVQPNTSVLKIDKGLMEPGEYIVSIDVKFPSLGPNVYFSDSLIVRVYLTELIAHINGGEYIEVPYGGNVYIDASISTDLSANMSSVADIPLDSFWQFANYPGDTNHHHLFELFEAGYPRKVPVGGVSKQVLDGTDYILEIDTSMFAEYTMNVVLFTLRRGDRMSTAAQVIKFLPNAVPVSIACVYNCLIGRRVFLKDKVQLDTVIDESVDVSTISFSWSFNVFGSFGIYWRKQVSAPVTGFHTRSIGVTDDSFNAGKKMRIQILVSGGGYATTKVRLYRTVNRLPSGGTCVLSSLAVVSARDWVTVTCSGWQKYGNINPILTYVVRQKTVGALVEEEPILNTRSHRSHMILKVGTPGTFATQLFVHVTDQFRNSRVVALSVISNPAFDYASVGPNEAGAALVRSYTEVDYPFDETQLMNMGKSDLTVSLVSAVCSNVHLVVLPIWKPPVPRVLNTGGAVLDLSPDGNTNVGTLDKVMVEAENETIDPATIALQEVMQQMVAGIRLVVDADLLATRKGDKYLSSIILNAFTNLAAKSQFVNQETKVDLIYLSQIVGVEALDFPENSTEDLSAQIETVSGEVFNTSRAVANAVVPDNLREIRIVDDLVAGREQIAHMLDVLGGEYNISGSVLSSDERAYLYERMQKSLALKNNDKKQAAKDAARMAILLAQTVQETMKVCKTCDNEDSLSTNQLVRKNNANTVQTTESVTETSLFRLDGLVNTVGNTSEAAMESISVSAFEFQENVFMYDEDRTSSYITSNVLRIDTKTSTTRLNPDYLTFDQTIRTPNATIYNPLENSFDEDASEFVYHKYIYGKSTDYTCIRLEPLGDYNFTSYKIYFRFTESPSIVEYDFVVKIEAEYKWQKCIPPTAMQGHVGIIYYGISVKDYVKQYEYSLTLMTVGCLTWCEAEEKWYSDKCEMEWIPRYDKITCFCQNVTDPIFANSFIVAPNSIDFSTVFLKFSPLNQAAVMGAIGGILLIYIIVVLLLVGKDRRDKLKWGITPLRDNYITYRNYYLIRVVTGMRRGAGTCSRIAFTLTGAAAETGPREMFDGLREEFSTGSIMTFFMATPKHLGHLQHLYIWHDNSGDGDQASWYLNQVAIYDITTKQSYTFSAERWLSVSTTLDCNMVAVDSTKPVEFESRFFFQTRDRLSESHMWVSMWYRPSLSTFTRVQRASCALVYIFLTMIANAMYFNPDDDYQTPALIQVGPFRFTPQQIFISIVCALITTPVVMLLIFLFKRTKRKPGANVCGCHNCWCGCCARTVCCQTRSRNREYDEALLSIRLSEETPDFRGGLYLPWWCIYFAWLLFLAGTIVPAFFILLYSMEWGKQKSEEWLSTFLMSLFESMLFVDPILVLCLAFVFACLFRSSKNDSNINIDAVVDNYHRSIGYHQDDYNTSIMLLKKLKNEYKSYVTLPRYIWPPLQGEGLNKAAQEHKHQVELSKILKDILLNFFFVFIVLCICYGSRDERSYRHHEEMVNQIVTPAGTLPKYNQIKTPGDFFSWVNNTVIPSLFPLTDYVGSPLHWYERQFISNMAYMRLGPPRMRQMRVNKEICKVPYFGEVECFGDYSVLSDEERDYCIGWRLIPCAASENVYNASGDAWLFTSAIDIWGMPIPATYKTYGGGGYIAQFDVSRSISLVIIDELYRNRWLDRQTRAVFYEFTLYVPSTNIFIYHSFIVEFPETGGAFTTFSIYPIRVYNHVGAMGTFTLVCEVIFVLYLVVLLVKMCIRFYQQRCGFFRQFWQVYELCMFCIAVAAIGIYAVKMGMTYLTIEKYKKDIKQFVNFAHMVMWDQILVTLLATLVFMATLRVLEAFASSKKVSALLKIFQQCGADLFWYGMAFLYILFAFCFLGHFLFGKQIQQYMDILETLTTLSLALIGKSTYSDIISMHPILAQLFFMLYVLTVVFFTLTIFLSILGASIDSVVHDTIEDQREDLIEHMMKKVKMLFSKPDTKDTSGAHNRLPLQNELRYVPPEPFQIVSLQDTEDDVKSSQSPLKRKQRELMINTKAIPLQKRKPKVAPICSN